MGICTSAIDQGKEKLKGILNDDVKWGEYCDQAFDKCDTNQNGEIEQAEVKKLTDELIKKIKPEAEGLSEDQLKDALAKLDTNADGKINKEEFKKNSKSLLMGLVAS